MAGRQRKQTSAGRDAAGDAPPDAVSDDRLPGPEVVESEAEMARRIADPRRRKDAIVDDRLPGPELVGSGHPKRPRR
jgi:hypothetical protein